MTKTFLSEIEVNHEQHAILYCTVQKETELSIILQDELGRSLFQKNYSLGNGKNTIELELPKLRQGLYNAWIEVDGETFIRGLAIEAGEEEGFFSKFKVWLNLF